MIVATAIASVATFAVALRLLGVARVAGDALAAARRSIETMRDADLDDLAREKAIQQAALRLFGTFASILMRGLLAVAASLAPIWLGVLAGLVTSAPVFQFLSRSDVILAVSVAMIAGHVMRKRQWLFSRTTPT